MRWAAVVIIAVTICSAVGGGGGGCEQKDAKVQIDLTTPRSAATVFTRALEAGDVETAKSAAYGGGLEIEWVEAMARAMSGMQQLVVAARTKFGAEADTLVAGKQTLHMSTALKDAEIQMNGERATVIPTGGDGVRIPMKRIDGNWKIDIGLMTRGEDISYVVKELRAMADIAPRLTKDVEAGKFKTVQELRREMTRSVTQTVFSPTLAQPTTNQSAPPPDDPPAI